MSTVERITQISHRIFNTSKSEQSTSRTSNPFAASNFQKNILTEDVFESSKKANHNNVSFTGNLTASSKRIYSTFVGSLNDFGNKFSEGIESIMEFGNRMKQGLVSAWNKIQEIGNREVSLNVSLEGAKNLLNKEVSMEGTLIGAKNVLGRDIKSFFVNSREREISKMSKMDPKSEVKPMFTEALSALEADMVQAA